MKVYNMQANHLWEPIGIDGDQIHVSWCLEGGKRQSAFRIRVLLRETILEDSGKVYSDLMYYDLKKRIPYKSEARIHVDVWDENDCIGDGCSLKVVTGIDTLQWKAKWIDPELSSAPAKRKRASYLKKEFTAKQIPSRAMLYITAYGIFNVYLNGKEVSDHHFMPGTSQENKRLMVETLEVTPFVNQGENELLITLGDGWHRGSMGYDQNKNVFGEGIALLCQLEADDEMILASDESWAASQDGPLGFNDFMGGEEYDARIEKQTYHPVRTKDFGYGNLYLTDTVPIRPHERLYAQMLRTPSGQKVLDFGQNIAGYVTMEFDAPEGERIRLVHGETLDAEGNFTIQNFQAPHVKTEQEILYISKEGHNSYHPTKTYMGFRYVLLDTEYRLPVSAFTAVAVYSDMRSTAEFSCGVREVNQLFSNVVWSMKGNFVGVPTDCPTREKSGFSGDAQVFVNTGMYLMDAYPVYAKWLREQAATQWEDGCVAQIAPSPSRERTEMDGGIGWSDSFVIVPWKLAERYGDVSILEELYEKIQKWISFRIRQSGTIREANQERVPKKYRPYVLDQGWLWGEWLEPEATDLEKTLSGLKSQGDLEISTAFYAYTMELASCIAAKLGKEEDALLYDEISRKAKEAYHMLFLPDGKIEEPVRQCRYVRPIAFGILTQEEKQEAAKLLSKRIRENGDRLNTGFLSTNEICRVLSDNGLTERAYDLLLQTKAPGWLNSVLHGATTIPENWNAYRADGARIDSFNHYSYGSVAGWLIGSVCGIRMEWGEIVIEPKPDRRLCYAGCVYESPKGRIQSGWRYQDGEKIQYKISIPANSTARVCLADGRQLLLGAGTYLL